MILPSKKYSTSQGFTFVEIIIIITIFGILGTIGFLSMMWYSSRARDSARIGDISQTSKSLDLSIVTIGSYPTPDGYFTVSYSWWNVWSQGTIGDWVMGKLHSTISGGGLSKKPVDPLQNTEYIYSSLSSENAYQIKTEYENDWYTPKSDLDTTLANFAYIDPEYPSIAYIRGNYGGIAAKTLSGTTICILALPSIITGTGSVGKDLEITKNTLSGTLLFNGKNSNKILNYNPNISVFCGTELPKNDASWEIIRIVSALKNAYSGSDIETMNGISSFLSLKDTGALVDLGHSIIHGQLWGKTNVENIFWESEDGVSIPPSWLTLSHTSRSKIFSFSWTGGMRNGKNCKLQYLKNTNTWTDITTTTYDCDTTILGQDVTLPWDNWYSGNWNEVPIRVIRTSDTSLMGIFWQKLSCSTIAGKEISTPNIDEDCNGVWDDRISSENTTYLGQCNTNVNEITQDGVFHCNVPSPSSCQSSAASLILQSVSWSWYPNGSGICYWSAYGPTTYIYTYY